MKILYHHRVASRDGQDVHIEAMVAALRRQGHDVTVIGPPRARTTAFGFDGGLVARVKRALPGRLYELLELSYALIAFLRLWRVWRRRRPDVLYERYSLFCPAGAWLRRLGGPLYLLEVNAPLAAERGAHGGLALPGLARWSERQCWLTADLVLPVSAVLADWLRAAGVPGSRLLVVHNGVDPRLFHPQAPPPTRRWGRDGEVVIGFAGFVRDWHGLPRVIDAMAALDGRCAVHLVVIGDGPGLIPLRSYAAARGQASHLTCCGLVPRQDMPALLAHFDIALQPRAVDYASPLKLFEYMALGLAIIAPDQPNIREILIDGETGLLVADDDPAALAAAIARLAGDRSLRHRLGTAAAADIARRGLTWDDNARLVCDRITRLTKWAVRDHFRS